MPKFQQFLSRMTKCYCTKPLCQANACPVGRNTPCREFIAADSLNDGFPYPSLTILLDSLSRGVVRILEKRGLLIPEPGLDFEMGSSLEQLQAASIQYRIAIGPHAGRKALTFYSVPPEQGTSDIPMLARLYGFSLHAATVCETYQRSKLAREHVAQGRVRL